MKRPSFQFYPGDWSANPNLKRCTFAERGIWVEVMCLMHDQEPYGVLRWPLKEIAQAIGCKVSDLQALERKGVLKGADEALTEPYVYTPRSGRKDGEPVILIPTQAGPIWYSSRMVKDEYVRTIRGESTGNGEAPKRAPKASPKGGIGATFGPRGFSSSSSASAEDIPPSDDGGGAKPAASPPALPTAEAMQPGLLGDLPDCPHEAIIAAFHEALPTARHVRDWTPTRAQVLRARWREDRKRQNLDWWRRFFAYCGKSAFLTGRASTVGRRPFELSLDWLVKSENFVKVREGAYHDPAEVADVAVVAAGEPA